MNGQYCTDETGPFYEKSIPTASLRQLLPWLEQSGLACSFVELDYGYLNRVSSRCWTCTPCWAAPSIRSRWTTPPAR